MTDAQVRQDGVSSKPRGADQFLPVAWLQMAPMPLEVKPSASPLELASMTLGITGMCIHWVAFLKSGLFLFVAPLALGILAIVFGFASVRGLFRKDHVRSPGEGSPGIAGLSLGILTVIFTISWLLLAQFYLWGWKP